MTLIPALKVWADLEILTAPDLNNNFDAIRSNLNGTGAFTDVARTWSAIQIFNATPVFNTGVTITAGGITVAAGGIVVTAGGISANAGGLTIGGDGADITGNSIIDGDLDVTGTITGTFIGSFSGTVPASSVTAGTFPGAAYSFSNSAQVTGQFTAHGFTLLDTGYHSTKYSANISGSYAFNVDWANSAHLTLTGNTTFSFLGIGSYDRFLRLRLKQDGTGGRTVTWSGVTWDGGTAPVQTSAAGRSDWYEFWVSSLGVFGRRIGADYA